MANTAALLGDLLNTNADINYYTQQSIFWNAKYEANQAKLQKQIKYEEKWENAYDSACPADKDLKIGSTVWVKEGNTNEVVAERYADRKVQEYDRELSEELAELDIEYDTMKTMYDTVLEELRAQKDAKKTATSTAAQDTCLLGQ